MLILDTSQAGRELRKSWPTRVSVESVSPNLCSSHLPNKPTVTHWGNSRRALKATVRAIASRQIQRVLVSRIPDTAGSLSGRDKVMGELKPEFTRPKCAPPERWSQVRLKRPRNPPLRSRARCEPQVCNVNAFIGLARTLQETCPLSSLEEFGC